MAPDTVLRRAAVRGPSRAVSKPEAAHDALLSPSGDVARTALALAVLASEIEVLVRELALGLSLDVPRTLEAARSVVSDTFAGPFIASGAALEMLEPGKHRERVAASGVIAVAMARAAGWQEDECLELAACALLHDAPYPWLAGSQEEEAAEGDVEGMGRAVSRRPLRAHMLLADADGLAPAVALAALQAEERMDGSGRPFGLTADEILPGARMLAVADEFCRAVSRRRARGRLSGHEAVKRCIELAGAGLLDGDAVRALLNAVGLYPLGSLVRLSTGEIARVVATSEAYERPIVKVTLTPSGLPPAQDRVMDLSRLAGIRVERAVPGESGPPGGKGPPGFAED